MTGVKRSTNLRALRLERCIATAPGNTPNLHEVANVRKQKTDGSLGIRGQRRDRCLSDRVTENAPWSNTAKGLSGKDAVRLKEAFGSIDPGPSSCSDAQSLEAFFTLRFVENAMFIRTPPAPQKTPSAFCSCADPSCLAWRVREYAPQGMSLGQSGTEVSVMARL